MHWLTYLRRIILRHSSGTFVRPKGYSVGWTDESEKRTVSDVEGAGNDPFSVIIRKFSWMNSVNVRKVLSETRYKYGTTRFRNEQTATPQ